MDRGSMDGNSSGLDIGPIGRTGECLRNAPLPERLPDVRIGQEAERKTVEAEDDALPAVLADQCDFCLRETSRDALETVWRYGFDYYACPDCAAYPPGIDAEIDQMRDA